MSWWPDCLAPIVSQIRLKPFYLPPSGPASNQRFTCPPSRECTPFFVCTEPAIFNCLLHVGPVACRRQRGPHHGIPKNANALIPTRSLTSTNKEECDGTHANRTETRVF